MRVLGFSKCKLSVTGTSGSWTAPWGGVRESPRHVLGVRPDLRERRGWSIIALGVPKVVDPDANPETVKRLVSLGGSKFNVSTDLKHALIDSTYEYLSAYRDEYNPGALDKAIKAAIGGRIDYWIDLLGCAGKA